MYICMRRRLYLQTVNIIRWRRQGVWVKFVMLRLYIVTLVSMIISTLFIYFPLWTLANAASVTLSILPNGSGIKGSSVHIGCPIADYSSDKTAVVYKMTTVDALPGSDLIYCTSTSNCFTLSTLPSRYTYNRNTTGMYLTIYDVQHEDTGWWRCGLDEGGVSSNVEQLVVYTLASAVEYISQPAGSVDLGTSDVTLTCQTSDCGNPAPTFTWYYMHGTTRQLYTPSVTGVTVYDSGCTSPENKYSRTLTLPRYSTLTGNIPKTTRFQCGMTQPFLSDELFTDSSVEITFAVLVTSVVLKDGGTTITTGTDIQADIGTSKSLSVEWFPINSNPVPTVTCYSDSHPITLTGSVFTITVREQDHQKNIYCTAVNSNTSPVTTATARIVVVSTPEPPSFLISGSLDTHSVSLFWLSGDHGDADQTFHIDFRRANGSWVKGPDVLGGQIQGQLFNVTVSDLTADTRYEFRISASSSVGSRDLFKYAVTKTCSAIVICTCSPCNNIGAAVGGSVGGLYIVVVISVFVVWYCRKTGTNQRPDPKKSMKREHANKDSSQHDLESEYYNIGSDIEDRQTTDGSSCYQDLTNRGPVVVPVYQTLDVADI